MIDHHPSFGDPPEAVEVELTDKSARRLDEILRAWRRSLAREQFARVRYLCSPRALPYVSGAAERIGTGWAVDVEPLDGSDSHLRVVDPARMSLAEQSRKVTARD